MSAPIRVLIRADAGTALGTGHFARASALTDALSAAGGTEIMLVTSDEGSALVPAYFPSNMPVLAVAPADSGPAGTMSALRQAGWAPDVIYLDQYGEVPEWEAYATKAGARLLVLDDLDAATRADVIVRPHGGNVADEDAIVLRGPAYLPLSRHVTALAHRARSPSSSSNLRLNVCFGGSDPTGETAKALQALGVLDGLEVDLVIGPGVGFDPAMLDAADHMPHVTLHRAPSQERLAALMSEADLALGAGGVMLWERMCLGVPSLVICVAHNQRPQIDAMVAAGAIRFVGDHAEVTTERIAQAVMGLAADEPARRALAATGRKLVDGRGAIRLAAWLRALALGARDVRPDDAEDLLNWRTDDRNWQHNWEQAEKPDLAAHMSWLEAKLADPDCVFRILTRGDEPVGVVRFDLGDAGRSAYLSIYLVPAWHGRKMGLAVLFAAERALRRSHPAVRQIVSRIHRDNLASERLHRDAGFEVMPSNDRADWLDARKLIDS
jgi:spore coat polysaccharide biosynthesis predicted glycosyltransferase SpsG/RimJ/RimL family protein N-acetyltransferase